MTIKEITAKRKAGLIEEALGCAEIEYTKNANKFTAGALFWCLNDLYKKQQGADADNTFERMKEICEEYGPDDELMAKTLESINSRRSEIAHDLNDALSQAKAGNDVFQKYNDIAQLYRAGELDQKLFDDFGWLIYYILKSTPVTDAFRRKKLLAQYLSLNLKRPSVLHSIILSEAIKVEQNTPLQFRIRDFIRMWGIENLREEDWAQYRTKEGHALPSPVEKLIGVYVKELKTDGVAASKEMAELVDKALQKYQNSQNMPYFKAAVLISLGRNDEALGYYRDLILRFPTKFYLWHHAAELVEDVDTKIGLLCKALSKCDDDSFLGGVRMALATVLLEKGMPGNAKTEMEKYRETYTQKGWSLKQEFRELYNRIPATTVAEDNSELYAKYITYADGFIYSSIPSILVLKVNGQKIDDRNHPGRFITQWTLKGENQIYRLKKPAKFGLDNRTPNGAMFEIKIQDKKIVWIQPIERPSAVEWLKNVSGVVTKRQDKNGKDYAIIHGVFVGSDLLKKVSDGETITVIACRQTDGRWSAIQRV